jgi:hypothetical protein
MIAYIDSHRDQFGLELICRVLRAAIPGFLTSRGYGVHHPGSFHTKDERRFGLNLVPALTHQQIGERHPSGHYIDDDTVTHGLCGLGDHEVAWWTKSVDLYGFHPFTSIPIVPS